MANVVQTCKLQIPMRFTIELPFLWAVNQEPIACIQWPNMTQYHSNISAERTVQSLILIFNLHFTPYYTVVGLHTTRQVINVCELGLH